MSENGTAARDGNVTIHISEDFMKAEVDLYPPESDGASYTVVSVKSDLEARGVSWGIDSEGLEKNILRCLTEGIAVRGVPAAAGQKPKKAVPSYWHLKKRLLSLPEADLRSPNVDYRNTSPYIMVKKGEPLAKMVPEAPGEAGRNLRGESLPAGVKDVVSFRPGENLIEKENVLFASCSGRFEIREKVMSVNETLEIPGNVDYSTGHIAFPGDVIIRGSVCDGFRVAAGKSIFVKQTMDASQVLSRGDLIVEGGIKGRRDALVRVDGRVNARFIENASVESHGDIQVEKSVVLTNLYTLGLIDLGDTGILVGGDNWAKSGIRAGHIGRPESPAATLRAGSDYVVARKLTSVQSQVERLELKLDKLKSRHSLNAEQQKLILQVEDVLGKMRQSEKGLLNRQHSNRDARITVFGKVVEGTEIHICELSLRVSTTQEGVTFYYENDGPRIGTRDITSADKSEETVPESEPAPEAPLEEADGQSTD